MREQKELTNEEKEWKLRRVKEGDLETKETYCVGGKAEVRSKEIKSEGRADWERWRIVKNEIKEGEGKGRIKNG